MRVVVFAKNEERTIGTVLEKILINFNAEDIVVIVSRDTVDRTREIARQKDIKVMEDSGRGKGAAIRMAIDNITDDILVFIDADGSHKIEEIPGLLEPIKNGKADLVVASRLLGKSDELSGSIANVMHYIGNVTSAFMINLIWGKGRKIVTDCQNGFRAVRRDVAARLDLKEASFAIEQEMVIKCIKKGYRIHEIPSHELRRQHGESHINSIKMLPKYIGCFLRNLISL